MLEIEFHEHADEELKAATIFYESRQSGLGAILLQRISEGCGLLRARPLAGRVMFDDFRRILIRQFPYSLVYRLERDRIYLIAVAHLSRRPGYWKERG